MPTTALRCRFDACVGDSLDDAWFLALRYETALGASGEARAVDRTEWWLGRLDAGATIGELWATRTPLSRLVKGPDGTAYVLAARAAASGDLGEASGVWQLACESDAIRVSPVAALGDFAQRIGALADGALVAWDYRGVLRMFDGENVADLPHPPIAELAEIAGPDRTRMIACGLSGQVALWDGRAWSPAVQLPVQTVRAVAVVSPHEAYAAGVLPNDLFRWDGRAWSALASCDPGIADLAALHGELVVALDAGGLARVRGGRLEPPVLERDVTALRVHAGAALLATDDGVITETRDLRGVRRVAVEDFASLVARREPLWRGAQLDASPVPFTRPLPRSVGLAEIAPVRIGFGLCVGASLDAAFVLASRAEPVERPSLEERESIVARVTNRAVDRVTTSRAMLRDLQLAPSGRLYVAAWSQRGGVWRTPPDGELVWERLDAPPMQGLFALDDSCVMAWGGAGAGAVQDFVLYDGQRFRAIPSPEARVLRVHGCAPDWIVAVGHDGLIARWDGQAWQRWTVPTRGTFGNVCVVSPDEMYATGPLGALYEGSRYGWTERAPVEGAGVGLAHWRGAVWVGDPVQGLLRLNASRLEPVKLPVHPFNLHAGADALLMVERDGFADTRDVKAIRRLGAGELEVALRDRPPSWR